jgi:hypothetical protein
MFSPRKKTSNSVPANRLASRSHSPFPTRSQSQSHSQSPQQTQQSQPLYPWSAHIPPHGQWPSPFPRRFHALSTIATAAGELYLFGGNTHDRTRNDLYMISTRDFSTTLLQTSGDVPSPRYGHLAVLIGTTFLVWGGRTDSSDDDDSFYLLDLGTSDLFNVKTLQLIRVFCVPVSREWTRIVVDGPGPGGRYYHTMTLVGSKLFVFGGRTAWRGFDDIWALDWNCCTFAPRFSEPICSNTPPVKVNPRWESCEPAPGNKKPLMRAGHVSVTTGDRIIMFVPLSPSPS